MTFLPSFHQSCFINVLKLQPIKLHCGIRYNRNFKLFCVALFIHRKPCGMSNIDANIRTLQQSHSLRHISASVPWQVTALSDETNETRRNTSSTSQTTCRQRVRQITAGEMSSAYRAVGEICFMCLCGFLLRCPKAVQQKGTMQSPVDFREFCKGKQQCVLTKVHCNLGA